MRWWAPVASVPGATATTPSDSCLSNKYAALAAPGSYPKNHDWRYHSAAPS